MMVSQEEDMKRNALKACLVAVLAIALPLIVYAGGTQESKNTAASAGANGAGAASNVVRVLAVSGPETDALIKYAPEFEKQTGITASIEQVARSLWSERKVQALVQNAGIYDVVMIGGGDDWLWTKLIAHTKPLDQYLSSSDISQIILKQYWQKDGKLFGVPQYYNFPMLFYRKDMLEDPQEQAAFKAKYGHDLTPPKTYQELQQVAEFFNRPPNMYGFFVGGVDWSVALDYEYFTFGNGTNFGNLDTGALTLNTPAAVQAMTALTNMTKYNPPGWETESFFDGDNLFQSGKIFMYQNWFYIWQTLHSKMGDKVGMVPVVGDKQPGEALGAFVAVIPSVAPEPENGGKFIAWMLSPKYQEEQTLATGDLPVRQDVMDEASIQQALTGLDQFKAALPYMTPSYTTWPAELQGGISEAIWRVLKHQMTPAEALDWLQNTKFKDRKAIEQP
jgi:multiple sugar transport system substrate-binding protein